MPKYNAIWQKKFKIKKKIKKKHIKAFLIWWGMVLVWCSEFWFIFKCSVVWCSACAAWCQFMFIHIWEVIYASNSMGRGVGEILNAKPLCFFVNSVQCTWAVMEAVCLKLVLNFIYSCDMHKSHSNTFQSAIHQICLSWLIHVITNPPFKL